MQFKFASLVQAENIGVLLLIRQRADLSVFSIHEFSKWDSAQKSCNSWQTCDRGSAPIISKLLNFCTHIFTICLILFAYTPILPIPSYENVMHEKKPE